MDHLNNQMERYSIQLVEEIFSDRSRIKPFDEAEKKAMQSIKNNPEGFKSIIDRLFQLHSRDLFFDFFCIIDGVGDPDDPEWTGVLLIDKPADFDEHVEFLHDEL